MNEKCHVITDTLIILVTYLLTYFDIMHSVAFWRALKQFQLNAAKTQLVVRQISPSF